ncbi:MAG: porin [Sneathiella sp.]
MTKFLSCTTALVSLLSVGSLEAAEKIKLNVGGYLHTSFVAADYDSGDRLPTNLRNEGEIHFTGSTILDNGVKFGVNIQLEARESSDQVDETFMFVESAYGRVNVGSENSAAYLMHYAPPEPVAAWGLNDPTFKASGFTTPSTYPLEVSDADKITYFSPRLSGFQFGASYTPDADWQTGTGSGPYDPILTEGEKDEAYSIAVNYANSFNGVSVKTSAGYDIIMSSTRDDIEETSLALRLGYGGFSAGGAYRFAENGGGTDGLERHEMLFGATYTYGPWTAGAQYSHIELDEVGDGTLDALLLGGTVVLGPGVSAYSGIQFYTGDDDLEGSEGEDATIFFIGTSLSF